MKTEIIILPYFVRCTRNGSICYMSWKGQTQDQVNALLVDLGATDIQFIDETTYQAAIQALQKVI